MRYFQRHVRFVSTLDLVRDDKLDSVLTGITGTRSFHHFLGVRAQSLSTGDAAKRQDGKDYSQSFAGSCRLLSCACKACRTG